MLKKELKLRGSVIIIIIYSVDILAVRHVKEGIEAEGFRTEFLKSLRFMVYHL